MSIDAYRWPLINLGLLLAAVWTALAVIGATHESRALYARLQNLQSQEWHMQEDWSRLLLEESAWAAHHRVAKLAEEKLHMHPPKADAIKVLVR